jgi:Rrf2 family protein
MLKLGRRVEYGLMALLHIAELGQDELATNREIAAAYNIPPEILGKVLQALKRAGLAASTHGSKGGYRLGRPLGEITIGNVLEAVNGPLPVASCAAGPGRGGCDQAGRCNIRLLVSQFRQRLADFVYRMPLSAARDEAWPAAGSEGTTTCLARIPKRVKTRPLS